MLSRHRQGGDKHGDTAQHEHSPHKAAQSPQKDGSTSRKNGLFPWGPNVKSLMH